MAALTPVLSSDGAIQYGNRTTRLAKESATVADNSAVDTMTTALAKTKRLLYVTVSYSGSATYSSSVTVGIDSGLGATYDVLPVLESTTDNLQDVILRPDSDFILASDDQLIVTIPDGTGVGETVVVVWEQLG